MSLLEKVWTERELAEKLGLPITKTGRSIQLGNWIAGGLEFVEKSGKRYFFEEDVFKYLLGRKEASRNEMEAKKEADRKRKVESLQAKATNGA